MSRYEEGKKLEKKYCFQVQFICIIFMRNFIRDQEINRVFHLLEFGAPIVYRAQYVCWRPFAVPRGPSLHSRFRRKGDALSAEFRNPFSNPGEPRPAREAYTRAYSHVPSLSTDSCRESYQYVPVCICIRSQTRFSRVRLLSLVCVRNVR